MPEVADSNEQADMVRTAWAPPWSVGVASTQRITRVSGRSGDLLSEVSGTRPIKLRYRRWIARSRTIS